MWKRVQYYLDFIPLAILIASAINFIWTIATYNYLLVWQNYVGFLFLAATIVFFFLRHLFGVLILGFTHILGLFNLLSFSAGTSTSTFGFGDSRFTTARFQPIFLLWILIYFIICGRYFFGIASKKYWDEVKENKR